MTNGDVNAKNWQIMEDVIKDLFEILVIVNVKVINYVMLRVFSRKKYRKRLIDKLVKECNKNIDGNKMIYNGTLNDYEKI